MVDQAPRLGIKEHRLAEVLALLPMLHLPKREDTVIAVSGKFAGGMAAEVQRWPDVKTITVVGAAPSRPSDKRLRFVSLLEPASVDLMLLSPEDDPRPYLPSLRRGGIINITTFDEKLWGPLARKAKTDLGAATPYREHLPVPIYGVLGRLGSAPVRVRQPPNSTRRLHPKYLPSLFTFGRDEVALLNPPGGAQ